MRTGFHHLTDGMRQTILTRTAEGHSQAEIAEALGIHRNSVYRTLASAGLALPRRGPRKPILTPFEEQLVFARLIDGVGAERIAAELQLRVRQVRVFAEEHFGRRRAPACRWDSLPQAVRDAIDAEIREHRNHATDIAAKFAEHGVTDNVVLRRAHDVLQCSRFRTGLSQPLSSDLPQKAFSDGSLSE